MRNRLKPTVRDTRRRSAGALVIACVLGLAPAASAATCRFDGVTSYDGRLAVSVAAAPIAGGVRSTHDCRSRPSRCRS